MVDWSRVLIAKGWQMRLRPLAAFVLRATAIFLSLSCSARADDVSLFDSRGLPVAYIDTDDKRTIYLWNGAPVAYLENRNSGAFNVWGFNGKHLGWFEKGAIWDRSGGATCAVREAFPGITSIEANKIHQANQADQEHYGNFSRKANPYGALWFASMLESFDRRILRWWGRSWRKGPLVKDALKDFAQLAVRWRPLPAAVEIDGMVEVALSDSETEFF